jgi:hypothetical protein
MRRKPRQRDQSKHQHWVPQFYLRCFATSETRETQTPQVCIFFKREADGDERLTNVRNVCGKRYLYSPRQPDGKRNWVLDDKLNDVEALLGQVWPSLATDFVDLQDEPVRKALALFVSIMHMRHPDVRQTVEYTHGALVSFYETGPKAADGTPLVDSIEHKGKSYHFDKSNWYDYKNQGKDGHDRAFAETVQSVSGLMAKHLLTKRWSVIYCERDSFITSDKPVVLQHFERERFGYGTVGTIVTFPLSPTRLLVLDDLHDEPPNQYYPLVQSNIGAVNLSSWRAASRYLITGRPISEVLAEILEVADAENDPSPLG